MHGPEESFVHCRPRRCAQETQHMGRLVVRACCCSPASSPVSSPLLPTKTAPLPPPPAEKAPLPPPPAEKAPLPPPPAEKAPLPPPPEKALVGAPIGLRLKPGDGGTPPAGPPTPAEKAPLPPPPEKALARAPIGLRPKPGDGGTPPAAPWTLPARLPPDRRKAASPGVSMTTGAARLEAVGPGATGLASKPRPAGSNTC